MISFKTHSALNAPEFERQGGTWEPHTHWIVPTLDDIEASFVQELLDKYGEHVHAYSILPAFGSDTFCVELQCRDEQLAKQCNDEYLKGFRKGGVVVKQKQKKTSKATKRLYKNRMYVLPDGTEFIYYAKWDHHGNLSGKVLTDAGLVEDNNGLVKLENRIEHRSVVEQAILEPRGKERFWLTEKATDTEHATVLDAVCRLKAKNSHYGPGDCFYGEPIEDVCKAVRSLSIGKIWSALEHLQDIGEYLVIDEDCVWVSNGGWREWSKWNDEYFLDVVFCESGQDWPDWHDRDYWKDIEPTVWKKLEDEYKKLEAE